ncbi:MAG: DUF1460 domain-containing protein [Elusimicrobia bacterium]|nr:DUF1460 domain-containing protein [Elusimicrobiota bacterium]
MREMESGPFGGLIMRKFFTVFFLVVAGYLFALPPSPVAAPAAAFQPLSKRQVKKLIKNAHSTQPRSSQRLETISEKLLGMPFKLGPLGEGPKGEFDRDPLIRFDSADCTTYVETVMALALAKNFNEAQKILQNIRYKGGVISYQTRNHFASIDWIANNSKAGFIDDITAYVAGDKLAWATKQISKRSWYRAKSEKDLIGFDDLVSDQRRVLAAQWQALGEASPDETARLPYLPLEEISPKIARIPSGSIMNLVREDKADMPDLISHQGFIIQKPDGAYVRQASWDRMVEDVALVDYLNRYRNSSWKLLGLNFNYIREP